MATATDTFTGFDREAIQFLVDLAENNDRAWFTPRKGEYERLLKQPLEALCVALDERSGRGASRSGPTPRSPFRIYRDVRFSKDKSPYKTNVAASFPYTEGEASAGGYFHFSPGEMYIGGGMWHPEPGQTGGLARVRRSRRGPARSLEDPASSRPSARSMATR